MYIINFLWNKIVPKSVVLRSWEKLEVLEKKVFTKKNPSSLQNSLQDLQNSVGNFFKINGSQDILLPLIFLVQKNCFLP